MKRILESYIWLKKLFWGLKFVKISVNYSMNILFSTHLLFVGQSESNFM